MPTTTNSKLIEKFAQLKGQIHSSDNNLVVFHLMGSHGDYCGRYPQSFAKFGDGKSKKSKAFYNVLLSGNEEVRRREIDCYDNSIAFTDYVLSQIFAEAKELPGFRAFVYLPDHAEAVDAGLMHDPQRFTFAMTHISLLVWLSDAFMTSEPDRAKALHQHENSVWTNDLLDDLLVGLTGIDAKNHDTELRSVFKRLSPRLEFGAHLSWSQKGQRTTRRSCPPQRRARPARLQIRFANPTL